MNKADKKLKETSTELEGVCPNHGQQIIVSVSDDILDFECGCIWQKQKVRWLLVQAFYT